MNPLFGPTPECLPPADLASPTAHARQHLDSCAYCRNELAMLQAFEAAEPAPDEVADVAWIAARLAKPAATPPRKSVWERLMGWLPTGTPHWAPAAGLAALVFAVGIGLYTTNRPAVVDDGGAPVFRSNRIMLVSPVGDVTAVPTQFVWREVSGATKYRMRLLEVDRTEVWSAETTDTRGVLPSGVAAQLRPGRTFLWQVSASNSAGPAGESVLQTFHISANTH